ncbi:MAG: proton-conducting transporter membrane subunit, partial [Fusobacteria bacterium]|nr:proton-conducting transporter membrane subunit [Fusobacteriota bacterium]
ILSLMTILVGAFLAINFSDMKAVLASSSVENMGIIVLAMAIYMLGTTYHNPIIMTLSFIIILFHCVSHGILKLSLFSTLGYIAQKYHSHSMEALGGVNKSLRSSSLLFLISLISMCAMPILNLFISEFLLFILCTLLLLSGQLGSTILAVFLMVFLAFNGTIILTAMVKLYAIVFLGENRTQKREPMKNSMLTLFLTILVTAQLYLTLFSLNFISILLKLFHVYPWIGSSNILKILQEPLKMLSRLSLIFIIFLLIYMLFAHLKRARKVETWGCGSENLTLKQQYTGESFTIAITNLIKLGTKNKVKTNITRQLFPKEHYLRVEKTDQFYGIYQRIYRFISKISYFVLWMESKNSQQNILYLLIIVIILTVWIFGGGTLWK